jgi:polyvinyl alcohol dehydrogenase (cytochrome)
MTFFRRLSKTAVFLTAVVVAMVMSIVGAHAQTSWPVSGADINNSRASWSPTGLGQLRLGNVGQLKVKWFFPTSPHGGVRDTPTVEPGGVYFTSSNGWLYKVDPDKGTLIWQHLESDYIGLPLGSRTSPAIYGNNVYIGLSGYVIAINKMTGAMVWKTLVDPHPSATVDTSPVIVGGAIYVGVASGEENLVIGTSYVPTFRGSVVKLNLTTGAVIWKTFTTPSGYTGAGVWGSSLVPDPTRGLVYAATGNNYTIPAAAGACVVKAGSNMMAQRACLDPADYVDTVLAFNINTGAIVWSRKTIGADAWNPSTACSNPTNTTCPTLAANGPYDIDFASEPNLFQVSNFAGTKDDLGGVSDGWVLGVGQKTGVYWGLNPNNGGMFWAAKTVPNHGGIQWGSAVDLTTHSYVFVALNDLSEVAGNDLVGRHGVPVKNWIGGAWGAIDAHNGNLVWQIPTIGKALDAPTVGGNAPGPVSFHNNIVFAGSTSGTLVAMDNTGAVYWTYNTNAIIQSGPAIANDTVYWGVGYAFPVIANPVCGVYAFSVNGT